MRASTPPSAIQTPVTGERPCAARAAFAGCSCSSICISDSQRRHGRAWSPCGRCGWIAPRTIANGVVRGRAGPATVANHASARGAWNARPSSCEVAVQRRDHRRGVAVGQVVDAALDQHVVAARDERDGIRAQHVRRTRIEAGAERGERRDRDVPRAAGRDEQCGVESFRRCGRRRRITRKARERGRAIRCAARRGKQVRYDERQLHGEWRRLSERNPRQSDRV